MLGDVLVMKSQSQDLKEILAEATKVVKATMGNFTHTLESKDKRVSTLTERIDPLETNRPKTNDANKGGRS